MTHLLRETSVAGVSPLRRLAGTGNSRRIPMVEGRGSQTRRSPPYTA
ncbi:hypothetical protein E2C01_076053 [Portunus trituberculatus]|uniref:Uncharacterized protein n=1 Tax=Portunus trituberculatus TaxID=210409 RepID=A0A5B7IIR5_PORTR|nr:hypothetical protein [Portunus trituberculatus]